MVRWDGVDTQFRRRFDAACAAIRAELGVTVGVVSAFRTRAEQQVLYDRWLRREPGANPAAKPGTSNHERGLAIDITPNSSGPMRDIFARWGLRFPVPGEPWHVEPVTARGGQYPATPGGRLDRPAPTLRRGSRGFQVRRLQAALNTFDAGLAVDGVAGARTVEAVRAFQRFWGLSVDGVFGPVTARTLDGALSLAGR